MTHIIGIWRDRAYCIALSTLGRHSMAPFTHNGAVGRQKSFCISMHINADLEASGYKSIPLDSICMLGTLCVSKFVITKAGKGPCAFERPFTARSRLVDARLSKGLCNDLWLLRCNKYYNLFEIGGILGRHSC